MCGVLGVRYVEEVGRPGFAAVVVVTYSTDDCYVTTDGNTIAEEFTRLSVIWQESGELLPGGSVKEVCGSGVTAVVVIMYCPNYGCVALDRNGPAKRVSR